MGYKCIAPGCKSGYDGQKCHYFLVPKDPKLIALWQRAILRDDLILKHKHPVCEKHFWPDDIIWTSEVRGTDGTVMSQVQYKYPRLRNGALPELFPNCPKYLTRAQKSKRKSPKKRKAPAEPTRLKLKRESPKKDKTVPPKKLESNQEINSEINDINLDTHTGEKTIETTSDIPSETTSTETFETTSTETFETTSTETFETINVESMEGANLDSGNSASDNLKSNLFDEIFDNEQSVKFPIAWGRHNLKFGNSKMIQFSQYTTRLVNGIIEPVSSKQIVIKDNLEIRFAVVGKVLDLKKFGIESKVSSAREIENLIEAVNKMKICNGCATPEESENFVNTVTHRDKEGFLRHNECIYILNVVEGSKVENICKACKRGAETISRKKRKLNTTDSLINAKRIKLLHLNPVQREKVQLLRKKVQQNKRHQGRLNNKINFYRSGLQRCQERMAQTSTSDVHKILEDQKIPANERLAINEMFKAAKLKNSKNRRYSDDWLMLCLLLHMKSPTTYNFLRDNNLLVLPCSRTIRKYLAMIDTPCGFDSEFLDVLKEHFDVKSLLQRHGLLLLDEMGTRKNIALDQKNMSYKGLADFGSIKESNDGITDKADHGLVLMFQPLYDNYSQPIAVFASKGPTNGTVLAKLIVQAIILLERAGAIMHGVVSDGASTNRKFWTELGMSGKKENCKNWFVHPTDEKRKVFAFSDICHLIKCVRNRLENKKVNLKVSSDGSSIDWEYFHIIYDLEKPKSESNRMCPRITASHLTLNNFAKMKVLYAVQIFSKSVAKALRYYKAYDPRLANCEATADFCERLNDLFDVLNILKPENGLTVTSAGFKTIESFLQWLDEWDQRVKDGILTKNNFLTESTAEGLRISLHSTMDLIKYLNSEYKCEYVLTGRINQDPLERFFGTVRMAGGSNDHPATPTFLQIYKILAMFSILKPPKSGNCSSPNETKSSTPLLSIARIKEIYGTEKQNKSKALSEIKDKLNIIIEADHGDFTDFTNAVDHDYVLPEIVDCLVYYTTGILCKRLKKFIKCDICSVAFFSSVNETGDPLIANQPVAILANEDGLTHPSTRLFNLIKIIERSFVKHSKFRDVYLLVLDDVTKNNVFTFPCKEHSSEIIASVIHTYLMLRMRELTRNEMLNVRDEEKLNAARKKLSKLCTT